VNVSVAPGAIVTRGTRLSSERPVERLLNPTRYAGPMNDKQEQKTSFRHFSTMPLWAKLALILAVMAGAVLGTYLFGQ